MAGFGRAVALTLVLVGELLGEPRGARLVETKGGGIRRRIARRAAPEPSKPLARSLSRFVFSTALCDSPRSMIRYAAQASAAYARRVVGLDR